MNESILLEGLKEIIHGTSLYSDARKIATESIEKWKYSLENKPREKLVKARAFRWRFPKNNEWPNDKELIHFDDLSLTMHLGRFYEKDQWGREKIFVTTEGGFFDSTMVDSWIPIFWTDKKESWDKSLNEPPEQDHDWPYDRGIIE